MNGLPPQFEYPAQALALISQQQIEPALNFLRSHTAQSPQDLGARHLLGLIHAQTGQLREAYNDFSWVASRSVPNAQLLLQLGQLGEMLGQFQESFGHYQNAVAAGGDSPETHLALGRFLLQVSQPAEALKVFQAGLNLLPTNADLYRAFKDALRSVEEGVQDRLYRKDNGPILMVGQINSGISYLFSELQRRLELCQAEPLVTQDWDCVLNQSHLDRLVKRRQIGWDHISPRKENICFLNISGIGKLWIHLRDPRQTLLSLTHWLDKLTAQRFKGPSDPYNDAHLDNLLGEDFQMQPFEGKNDRIIERFMPMLVSWIEGWITAVDERKLAMPAIITRFEDMKGDFNVFLSTVLDFYGIPASELRGEARIAMSQGECNFRKGSIDEWRSVFTSSQKARLEQGIKPALLARMGWSPF